MGSPKDLAIEIPISKYHWHFYIYFHAANVLDSTRLQCIILTSYFLRCDASGSSFQVACLSEEFLSFS